MRQDIRSIQDYIPQIAAVFAGTLAAVSDGMQYGWSAPVIPILESENSPVPFSQSDVVWLETVLMLGGLAGLPITIFLVDKVGRKNSILMAAVTSLICWILIGVARRVEMLYCARFFMGVAADVAFVSMPMYVAEIAEQKIRGFLSGLIYIMMLVGIVVVYSVAPYVEIYVSSIVAGIILLTQIVVFFFIPESPYYLLGKGKKKEAEKALKFFRNNGNVEQELRQISEAVKRQFAEKGRLKDLICVNSNKKGLMIMALVNSAQHFSGISVMLMNMHSILLAAGSVYLDSNTSAIIFATFMLIAAIAAVALVDKAGRRILLVVSCLLTGATLSVLATYFALKNSGNDTSSYSWIPIVCVMVYAATFKGGLGIIPIILTGELFPAKIKAMGMTIADATFVIASVTSLYLYQYLASEYGLHVPLFIFAGSCVFSAIFTWTFIPETKGKTLDEIQYILKGLNPEEAKRSNVDVL